MNFHSGHSGEYWRSILSLPPHSNFMTNINVIKENDKIWCCGYISIEKCINITGINLLSFTKSYATYIHDRSSIFKIFPYKKHISEFLMYLPSWIFSYEQILIFWEIQYNLQCYIFYRFYFCKVWRYKELWFLQNSLIQNIDLLNEKLLGFLLRIQFFFISFKDAIIKSWCLLLNQYSNFPPFLIIIWRVIHFNY